MTQGVIGALRVVLGADTAAFQEGMREAQTRLGTFGASLKAAGGIMAGAFAAAAAAGGAALIGFGAQALTSADNIGDAAARLGVSAEAFQKLGAAASAAGGTPELMTAALDQLNQRLGAFRQTGGGDAAEAFKTLGLSARIASGEIGSADQAFYAAARALESIEDPALKARLSMQLFGRAAGVDMLEVLAPGEEALRKFGDAAAASGRVMSDEMVAKLADAKLRLDETKLAASQMATVLAGEVIVGFADVLEQMRPFLDQVVEIGAQVGTYLKPSWDALVAAFTNWAQGPGGRATVEIFKVLGQVIGVVLVGAVKFALDGVTAFIRAVDGGHRAIASMVDGIKAAFDRMKSIMHAALEPIRQVQHAFWLLEQNVTGNSYVPDMVDEIERQMARLDTVMVKPVSEATRRANDAFRDLLQEGRTLFQGLMTESERATARMLGDLETLDQLLQRKVISLDAYKQAAGRVMDRATQQQLSDATIPMADAGAQIRKMVEATQQGASWGLENAMRQAEWQNTLRDNFGRSFSDGIRSALSGNIGDFIKGRLQQFAFNMFDRALQNLGGALFDAMGKSGGGGGFWGSVLKFGKNLLGFKTGGSFRVGGAGGPDSKLVSFRATPGEIVDVRRPGQAANDNPTVINVFAEGSVQREEIMQMIRLGQAQTVQVSPAVVSADMSRQQRLRR